MPTRKGLLWRERLEVQKRHAITYGAREALADIRNAAPLSLSTRDADQGYDPNSTLRLSAPLLRRVPHTLERR